MDTVDALKALAADEPDQAVRAELLSAVQEIERRRIGGLYHKDIKCQSCGLVMKLSSPQPFEMLGIECRCGYVTPLSAGEKP